MLNQVIQTVTAIATKIAQNSAGAGAVQVLANHIRDLLQTVVPSVSQLSRNVAGFDAAATKVTASLLTDVSAGKPAAGLVPQLQQLTQQMSGLTQQATSATNLTTVSRTNLANDSASLTTEQVQLKGEITGLEANREALSKEAAALRQRLDIINGISWVFPIVKLFDEIASLIQSSKSTESQLNGVNEKLVDLQTHTSQLGALLQQVEALRVGAGQLVGGVQSLTNVIGMINGQLQNDKEFANAADAKTATLYLTALQSNLKMLQQLA
jgi:chromosome segregation ATPase